MANHQIPKAAERIERHHGLDADDNVVTLSVYRHTREGHALPMFYVVQYREVNRRIDPATRWTREFSGPRAEQAMRRDLASALEMLAGSRESAGARLLRELRVSQGIDA